MSQLGSNPRTSNGFFAMTLRRFLSTTHFGFKTIPKDNKEAMVAGVFHGVADKYDLMNDFMSAGIHRVWKDEFVSRLDAGPQTRLLDVAGGTGDIAFRFLKNLKRQHGYYNGHVTVLDINSSMLKVGQDRADQLGLSGPHLDFVEGNAEILEGIPDESMDAYTIAFGIRNVTNIDKALQQAYRVIKPGGRFLCLEFSHVENPLLKNAYDLYSFNVIPKLGGVVANDEASYQYLVESIRQFPKQEQFAQMIRDAGFKTFGKGYTNLTFGVSAIHSGFKL
ncbi:UbiE/COQ5 methyltransferase [Gorgonomyces haynaldii]|nr:UbiE/COQ5 methyltransferase [Gorgonomyces haynaldii]